MKLRLTIASKVDVPAVAAVLNYKNPRSVSNRITELKKKYNLPLGTVGSHRKKKEAASSEEADPGKVEVPKTPSKERVTKSKAIPKNKATTKAKARGKKDTKVESENDGAVKEPTLEEEAFGNDSDDSSLSEAPEDEA
jgi:hypothetical protein